ncbi:hypothetical protein EFR00_06045 [Rhizobium sophoriradicis]|uniref:glycine betaine ABC transporter substrate-binding protein n=1 Tax=Rhizobium sophoriradicis TaxID=1535245 RepID=UPI00098F952A|nr:glycine betaine ABC transporter substrate-binding protein [Rhizobium sophoriradicis]RSC15361.1 hypothetical protein EFR00_06045 [Rhizobium sophoriradicis]
MKTLLISAVFTAAFSIAAPAAAEDCGQVSIAEMKWASAGIAANFDKIILERGYGCSVTIVAGDTLPTFASMNEKGTPDIASEYWINSVRALLDQAVKTGRLVQGAEILADGAVEGWFIPKFIADANPDIRSVEDALRHPELFPAEDDTSKGAIYNCPADWSCHISTTNLQLNSYPVSRAFTLMTRSFATRSGPVTAYLKARKWDNATINQVLAWQDENRESNEDAAIHFLRNYENLWSKWVPADIAEKIKASL